jgi:SAM-dependent MidA family methyltransferase
MGENAKNDVEQERLKALRQHLVELCEDAGPIPFARYMEICLYHPELGYYTAGPPPMGPDGDYVTYPSAHPAFGRLLARQLKEIWEVMGSPAPFTLVEMGGGRGSLFVDILDAIRDRSPSLWKTLDCLLVDQSPRLRDAQQLAISPLRPIRTVDPESFFQDLPPWSGCLISNELIDAFPVHLVEKRQGVLHELFVRVDEEEIDESLGDPSDPRIALYLEAMAADLLEGQRTEVHLAAVDWMERVGRSMGNGVVLTLDFGYTAEEYFHPWRSRGTLMSYQAHQASSDPYASPGGQDISAHVNFSALIRAGKQVGLEFTGLIPQDRFLLRLGLLEEMEALEAQRTRMRPAAFWKEKLSLRRLMLPQSPQGGFQVLIQHKGWTPPPLKGLG